MTEENIPKHKKDILRLALFVGEMMLANGAETYRVEDSIIRMCKSRGFNHVNVMPSPTVIIISDERFDGFTFMKTIRSRSINLNKISLLNNFSREFVNNPDLSIDESMEELKEIGKVKPYPNWLIYLCTGTASASFGYLLGGVSITDFLFTFIISILGVIAYDKIMKVNAIPAFATLMSSFTIALFGLTLMGVGVIDTPRMLIVGSIMPLLPGVSFIKGVRDLISGDLISGVARAFDAGLTAVSIAAGVGFVVEFFTKLTGIVVF